MVPSYEIPNVASVFPYHDVVGVVNTSHAVFATALLGGKYEFSFLEIYLVLAFGVNGKGVGRRVDELLNFTWKLVMEKISFKFGGVLRLTLAKLAL